MSRYQFLVKLPFFIIFSFFLIASLNPSISKNPEDFIVAKVNNIAITHSELKDRIKLFLAISGFKSGVEKEEKIVKEAILSKIIEESLIRQKAESLSIKLTENELDRGLEIVALSSGLTVKKIKKILKNDNLSFKIFANQVSAEILWSKIISYHIRPTISVSQNEIEQTLKRADLVKKQESFKISEILIIDSKNSKILAQKIYEELSNDADFNDMARNFSQSYNLENGANIGWVNKSQINKRIYDIISKLQIGEHSKPFKIGNNYRLFKLVDFKISKNFDQQDLSKVKNYLSDKKLKLQSKSYLMQLKRDAFIEIIRNDS